SYAALAGKAAGLATILRERGIGPGAHVALLASPSAGAAAGILGILATGAAWVPLDPSWPRARTEDVLAQSQCRALLLDRSGDDADVAELGQAIERIDIDRVSPGDLAMLADPAAPDQIAYVIFTSGSTGRPKGVPIPRVALARYLDWARAAFEISASDRMAATASIAFDASIRQLIAPLLAGATVVPVPRGAGRDPDALLDWIARQRLTIWSSVPTLWEQLLAAAEARTRTGRALPNLSLLRWILLGGEALMAAPVRRWLDLFGAHARIANLYGPTETTINAAYHVVAARPSDDAQRIPIGRAIDHRTLVVIDETGRACEPGRAGELVVGGIGVTPGYLGRAELDVDAFVVRDGARAYRTGDRVLERDDGALEFLGRLDDQVKIRGHRVEPGEIEAQLRAHPDVARAAVLAERGHEGVARLVAWIEPRASSALDAAALRAHLAARLPEAMLPARFAFVPSLPTSSAGKIDRAALRALAPDPLGHGATSMAAPSTGVPPTGVPPSAAAATAPSTPTELAVARAWSEVLEIPPPRRDDDFFALGGDSIAILSVFSRLATRFPALPRPTIAYRHRTVEALARAIDEAATTARPDATHDLDVDASEPFPLTPAQRGFLLAEALSPDARQSWVASFTLEGALDPERLQRAFDRLVDRHAMLRVELLTSARPPLQRELPVGRRITIAYEPDATPARVGACFDEERAHAFDPAGWPLVRVRLLRLTPGRHALIVHAHHLVGDGLSAALLARELLAIDDALHRGAEPDLPPLRTTFRQWVARSAEHDARAGHESDAFFRARFAEPYEAPRLRRPREAASYEPASAPRADRTTDAPT
ncbi:MAG: amino acid adenylation domain-containing protein, partial [Myxococcota bacterium]|nr:amino acid adenylation domain-containing protein [Myxococcota bacterium]